MQNLYRRAPAATTTQQANATARHAEQYSPLQRDRNLNRLDESLFLPATIFKPDPGPHKWAKRKAGALQDHGPRFFGRVASSKNDAEGIDGGLDEIRPAVLFPGPRVHAGEQLPKTVGVAPSGGRRPPAMRLQKIQLLKAV